jgi:hypothetical protein
LGLRVPLRCRNLCLSSDRVVVEVGALEGYGSRQLKVLQRLRLRL